MEKMLAVVFKGDGKFSLEEREIPRIKRDDEVLIEVEAASICGTDIQILNVPPGHPATPDTILGHEYTGKIIEKGREVKGFEVGDRVVIDPNVPCGSCAYCKMGRPNLCVNMTTLGIFIDGGFARYNVAPQYSLHRIPDDIPPEIAVFTEPLSCVVSGVKKLKPMIGETAVVLGAGPIGLYYIAIFKASGVRVIVSEPSDYRRGFAEEMGADMIVNPQETSLKDVVMDETDIGADIVVDAVGVLFGDALEVVRRGGKVLLFGMNRSVEQRLYQYDITRHEINVMGTYIADHTFPDAIRALKVLPLRKLITHDLKLQDFEVGLNAMRQKEAIEVILRP